MGETACHACQTRKLWGAQSLHPAVCRGLIGISGPGCKLPPPST